MLKTPPGSCSCFAQSHDKVLLWHKDRLRKEPEADGAPGVFVFLPQRLAAGCSGTKNLPGKSNVRQN